MARLAILLLVSLVVVACSKPSPPAGRWMAHYESAGTMVDARLEIAANGLVRVSALDLTDIQVNSDEDRIALHGRLANDLSEGWGEVAPRPMDFDGKVFRKTIFLDEPIYRTAIKQRLHSILSVKESHTCMFI